MSQTNFLRSFAKTCQDTFHGNYQQLTVIFPNKRAGLYFSKYLAALHDKPVWAPKILSLEEFVFEHSSSQLADELQLNLVLYQVYSQINPNAETFDHFYPWGEMILKDFNDIDNYLVDPDHIFRVIKSQKELDESFQFLSDKDQEIIQRFWKSFLPSPSKTQRDFLKTWEILKDLYVQFNAKLDEQQLAYKGKQFRKLAGSFEIDDSQKIWFAGFNALTKAEESIMKKCLDQKCNDIFWDIDEYYVKNEMQESGVFFREYANDRYFAKSIERDLHNVISSSDVEIEEVSASLVIPQVKYGVQRLDELLVDRGAVPNETVLILPNETFLMPLLQNMPSHLGPLNISMGLSISNSRVYKMMNSILGWHVKSGNRDSVRFDDLFNMLNYSDLLGIDPQAAESFKRNAIEKNRIYLLRSEVVDYLPELTNCFFDSNRSVDVLDQLLALTQLVKERVQDMELACLGKLKNQLTMIRQGVVGHDVNLDVKSLQRLFTKMGNNSKVTLSGEAFEGVQIMGALESRNLTFKNIIVIGMNEGNWPSESSNSSFIPFNIRKAFELPVQAHQDAMQAYLFYRLFHGAERIIFTYNNISAFNQNGEPSRYLQQIQFEQPNLNKRKIVVANPVSLDRTDSITFDKTGNILDKLNRYLIHGDGKQKRLSPSAISTYLDCRLKFYFSYVEGIKEPDEITEEMDPSLFGNLMHNTMEFLYEPFVGKKMTQSMVANLSKDLENAIERAFEKEKLALKGSHVGRQSIAHEVIRQFVKAILKYDEANSDFTVLALEEENYFSQREIEIAGESLQVGLKGIIDRIDQQEGKIRILDYKSGRDERKLGKVEALLDRNVSKRQKAAFQLLYYCMLVDDNSDHDPENIVPGLFNSSDLFKKDFSVYLKNGQKFLESYAEVKDEFLKVFDELLTEIFDPSVAFDQTDDDRKCSYCYFKDVCMR